MEKENTIDSEQIKDPQNLDDLFEYDDKLKGQVIGHVDERILQFMEPELLKSNTLFKSAIGMIASIEQKQETFFQEVRDYIESETQRRLARQTRKEKPKVFAGFRLIEKWNVVNGDKSKKNYNWYATQTIGGKRYNIYIGKDKSKSKNKIEEWLKQHPEVSNLIKKES